LEKYDLSRFLKIYIPVAINQMCVILICFLHMFNKFKLNPFMFIFSRLIVFLLLYFKEMVVAYSLRWNQFPLHPILLLQRTFDGPSESTFSRGWTLLSSWTSKFWTLRRAGDPSR